MVAEYGSKTSDDQRNRGKGEGVIAPDVHIHFSSRRVTCVATQRQTICFVSERIPGLTALIRMPLGISTEAPRTSPSIAALTRAALAPPTTGCSPIIPLTKVMEPPAAKYFAANRARFTWPSNFELMLMASRAV